MSPLKPSVDKSVDKISLSILLTVTFPFKEPHKSPSLFSFFSVILAHNKGTNTHHDDTATLNGNCEFSALSRLFKSWQKKKKNLFQPATARKLKALHEQLQAAVIRHCSARAALKFKVPLLPPGPELLWRCGEYEATCTVIRADLALMQITCLAGRKKSLGTFES